MVVSPQHEVYNNVQILIKHYALSLCYIFFTGYGLKVGCFVNTSIIGPLLDDRLKENLKNPETLKGCPLFSLSCLSVRPSVPELQSTPFGLEFVFLPIYLHIDGYLRS